MIGKKFITITSTFLLISALSCIVVNGGGPFPPKKCFPKGKDAEIDCVDACNCFFDEGYFLLGDKLGECNSNCNNCLNNGQGAGVCAQCLCGLPRVLEKFEDVQDCKKSNLKDCKLAE